MSDTDEITSQAPQLSGPSIAPGVLSQLQSYFGPTGRNAQTDMQPYQASDGNWYMPTVQDQQWETEGTTASPAALTGFRQTHGAMPQIGEPLNFYDTSGGYAGKGNYSEGNSLMPQGDAALALGMMLMPVGGFAGLLGEGGGLGAGLGLTSGLTSAIGPVASNALVNGAISAATGGDFTKGALGSLTGAATNSVMPSGYGALSKLIPAVKSIAGK